MAIYKKTYSDPPGDDTYVVIGRAEPIPADKLDPGNKYDDGKVRYDLIPPYVLNQIAQVFTYGANKYDPHNWEKGIRWSRLIGAIYRHIEAFRNGEEIDPESGLPHLSHALTELVMLAQMVKIFPQGDDLEIKPITDVKFRMDFDNEPDLAY